MLTVKQEKFCLEYAKTGNARQAYKLAGYKSGKDSTADVNACRLLKNDKIQQRLAEIAEEVKDHSIADIEEMQKVLTSILRQEITEEVVVVEGCGDGVSEARKINKKPSLKNITDAINTLARMQGGFVDKVKMEVEPVTIVNDLTE